MKGLSAVAFVLLAPLCSASAQSSLSVQGFGYPTSSLSTRALSAGGAIAELDPLTPVNPATLTRWGAAGVSAQFAPEYRTIRGEGVRDKTSTMRFPLYSAATSLATRLTLGISSATLLDRTWSSEFETSTILNEIEVLSTSDWDSRGALNEIRLAVGYDLMPSLQLGGGVSVITGSNRIRVATDFENPDFSDLSIDTDLNFSGSAFTAGLIWLPTDDLSFGASTRVGRSISMRSEGELLGRASVPDRFGVTAAYSGIAGALIAARFERVEYTAMNGLGSDESTARDTDDMGIGVEFTGPRLLGATSSLRLGARQRGLPFQAAGADVEERAYSFGMGLPFSRGRAQIDLGLVRLSRDNDSAYRESAWIFGAGILVRP